MTRRGGARARRWAARPRFSSPTPITARCIEYNGTSGAIGNWYAYALGPNAVLNQMSVAAGTRATLVPDILGSMVASLDAGSGTLTKIAYGVYGEGVTSGSFRYTGQCVDPETNGLYCYRARHYIPAWGRFMQVDPVRYAGGVNLYLYVSNDPLNLLDSLGLVTDNPKVAGQTTNVASVGAVVAPGAEAASAIGGEIAVSGEAAAAGGAAGGGIGAALGAAAAVAALAVPALLATTTSTASSSQDETQYVVRGGIATPDLLITRSAEHTSVPGLYGFSVQSAPGVSVNDLARAGAFPNAMISVTTTAELAGLGVAVIPSPGAGYHATVQVPNPLPPDLAAEISGVFEQQPNPFRAPR
jgi:RHS repeat-associated protein